MNLFFDLRLRYFVETPGLNNAVSELTFKQGDGEEVVIQFGRSPDSNGPVSVVQAPTWVAESLSATGSMKIGIKAAGDYSDGDLLAGLSSFTHDAALHTYTGSLDLNTTAINTLLNAGDADDTNDVAAIELALFELTFKTATGEPDRSSINDITTTIKHSVLSGTEGTPTNAGDPDDYALIVNVPQYLPTITGMVGGTATDLDSIATTSTPVGSLYQLVDASTGKIRSYELVAGTDAESSPTVVRPDDYSGTNEKVYKLVDPAAGLGGSLDNVSEDATPDLGGPLNTNSHSVYFSKGADITDGATITPGADGNQFNLITSTTTITAIADIAVGARYSFTFDTIRTINHSSALILPFASANVVTAVGDTAVFEQTATGTAVWKCVNYQRFDGKALTAGLTELADDLTPTAGGPLSMGGHQLRESVGTSIASASELVIPADGNSFVVSGDVTVSSLSSVAIGTEVELRFTGAPTLNHVTALQLPSAANIVVVAGDVATFRQTASAVWQCMSYTRWDGTALIVPTNVAAQVVIMSDVKAYNAAGGTFTAGAVRTRDLNTVDSGGDYVTLASNRFKLDAGTWLVTASAPARQVDSHWTTLYNYTQSSAVAVGVTDWAGNTSDNQSRSHVSGVFVADGTDELIVQHECLTSRATTGFGSNTGTSGHDSIYTNVTCQRIA
tara:strand:- start:14889 stop:16910 length:2022 start_codon:yes stop_codon:yes gene_type:complete